MEPLKNVASIRHCKLCDAGGTIQRASGPKIARLANSLAIVLLVYATTVSADFEAALAALEDGDYGAAMAQFLPLAEAEDAAAEYYLGVMNQQGWGVITDLGVAAEWYERAAERGNVKAQHNLATLLQRGDGLRRNTYMALQCGIGAPTGLGVLPW